MIQELSPQKDKTTQYSFPQGNFGLQYIKGKLEINVVLVRESDFLHSVR